MPHRAFESERRGVHRRRRDRRAAAPRRAQGPVSIHAEARLSRFRRGRLRMQPTLDDFLRHNVLHYGERIAVTIDDDARTHAQLARMVDEARALIGTLIEPGDRVALWLPNSFAW